MTPDEARLAPMADQITPEEEVLRLRDLLIAKEAELGALRGRVAELEGGAAPLVMLGLRLRTLLPSRVRSLLARLLGRG